MPSILDASGNPYASAPRLNGSSHRPASFLNRYAEAFEQDARDPAFRQAGNAPNYGRFAVPHMLTFQSIVGTVSKVFRQSDEALKHSEENARYMRNDCGVMECLEARQRGASLLNWHLKPEDEKSQDQKALCEELTKILQRMKRFTEYRRVLLEALWYGRYGIQHQYRWVKIGGRMRVIPAPHPEEHEGYGWLPINGDKLVFRYDDGDGDAKKRPNQVGIRVGAKRTAGQKIGNRWEVEATDRGLAYFLQPWERQLLAIHKHMIEDGSWDDAPSAGMIHGVGIRSRIYWDWFQKQESLGFLMEYLERSAGGIEVWEYPEGHPQALEKTKEAAKERISGGRNIVFFPKPMGEDADRYQIQIIEPGMAGIESLKDLLTNYFGHRIKRYILGQILTSEAEATGLGSGVADIHLDSFLQIVNYDAGNLDETITDQLIEPIKNWNFPKAKDIPVRFVTQTDEPDIKEKLAAVHEAWEMGTRIKERDVMDMIGVGIPTDDDVVLQNPALQQAAMQQHAMGQMPGQPAQQPAMGGPGTVERPKAPDQREIVDQMMAALFGDPESIEGRKVTYVAEGGKWVQREIPSPDFDTGDRKREAYSRQWNEGEHPRDEQGKFLSKHSEHRQHIKKALLDSPGRKERKEAAVAHLGKLRNELAAEFSGRIDGKALGLTPKQADRFAKATQYLARKWTDHMRDDLLDALQATRTELAEIVDNPDWLSEPTIYETDVQDAFEGLLEAHEDRLFRKFGGSGDDLDAGDEADQKAKAARRELKAKLFRLFDAKPDDPIRYSRDPDEAAKLTNTEPSDPQKDAGNYAKGKFWWRGLEISIENPKGEKRRGKTRDGEPWEVTMPCHYGYIRRTEGADGDQVDCFVGPDRDSGMLFVIDQQTPAGRFDEHKVMLGFGTLAEACQAYQDSYTDDATVRIGSITPLSIAQFKAWLQDGDTTKPIARQAAKFSREAA